MAAKKKTATAKSTAKKSAKAAKKVAAKKPSPRADFGKPVDGFFANQGAAIGPILDRLRTLIQEVAPTAEASLKWGQPFYTLDGAMFCALGAHKAHVNLILAGPAETFADPRGLLEGEGKTGRRLVVKSVSDIPAADIKRWLKAGAALAKAKA